MPVELACGARYLELATTLLQRLRLAAPTGGIWEAADVQWWSRYEHDADNHGRQIWLDDDGAPVAGVLRTSFPRFVQLDVVVLPGHDELQPVAWRQALSELAAPAALFPVRHDDFAGIEALTAAGYQPTDESDIVSSWLDARDRPQIPPLPPGYRLSSRADRADPAEEHPLVARNGPDIVSRLQRCSLYRPQLDLSVRAPDGAVAGYGLFWADPVTKVGLVEPMRTEPAFERRGIARHVLAAGLDLLAGCGCERFKVSNDISLYLQAGFQPLASAAAASYRRPEATARHG